MNIYRYFGNNGEVHSPTDAFLLALPSCFIYETSFSWPGSFVSGFGSLMKEISGNDANALNMRFFSRSAALVFDSSQVWNPTVGYDIQAAVLFNDDVLIICFRGSEGELSIDGFRDWFGTNLTFQLQDTAWGRGVRVHKGFYITLDALYGEIRDYVRPRRGNRKIYLTGHSTGGALALLCAYRLWRQQIYAEAVYTFGAPRIGNNGFAQSYAERLGRRTYRWANHLDLATQVPDVSMPPTPTAIPTPIEPYVHVGRLNYIESNGDLTHDLLDHDPMTISFPPLTHAVNDHQITAYLWHMFDALPGRGLSGQLGRDDVEKTALTFQGGRKPLTNAFGPRP
jgi:hypothetical protein